MVLVLARPWMVFRAASLPLCEWLQLWAGGEAAGPVPAAGGTQELSQPRIPPCLFKATGSRQRQSWLCRACAVSHAACSQQSAEQHLVVVLPALKHLAAWLANRYELPSEGQMHAARPALLV